MRQTNPQRPPRQGPPRLDPRMQSQSRLVATTTPGIIELTVLCGESFTGRLYVTIHVDCTQLPLRLSYQHHSVYARAAEDVPWVYVSSPKQHVTTSQHLQVLAALQTELMGMVDPEIKGGQYDSSAI